MADSYQDDDFVRNPNVLRPDFDAVLAQIKTDYERTPDIVHDQHYQEALRAMAESSLGRDIMNEQRSAVIVDDPEHIRRIHEAAARDAEKSLNLAGEDARKYLDKNALSSADTSAGNEGNTGATGGAANPAGEKDSGKAAVEPTSLEDTLAQINLNGERQKRIVIKGDPLIESSFYNLLAARGQLFYQNDVPMITLSRRQILKTLNEVVAEKYEGSSVVHAMTLKLDREGGGFFKNIKDGIANNIFNRRHIIDVVAIGSPEVINEQLADMGKLVTELEKKKCIRPGDASVENGRLVLNGEKDGPVKLEGTARLYDVLDIVKTKVKEFAMATSDQGSKAPGHNSAERPNYDRSESASKKSAAEEKAAGTAESGAAVKADTHSESKSESITTTTSETKASNQEAKEGAKAEASVGSARTSQDSKSESNGTTTSEAKASSLDAKSDGKADVRASANSERQVSKSDSSATTISETKTSLASAKDEVKTEASVGSAGSSQISKSESTGTLSSEAKASSLDAKSDGKADVRASANSERQASKSDSSATTTIETKTSSLDTKDGAKKESSVISAGNSQASKSDSSGMTTSESKASGLDAKATAREYRQTTVELHQRIGEMAKAGPSKLTAEKAELLVSSLDGIRSKPLASLDARSGDKPTATLANAEALLKEVQSGRFGSDLQSRAKDLSDVMQKWTAQDSARQTQQALADGKDAQLAAKSGAEGMSAKTSEVPQPASAAASDAQSKTAPQSTDAANSVREQTAQRLWETESAGAKLSSMLANPPGTFTNRDKTWNHSNIQRAAQEVLRVDPNSVSQLSPAQQVKVAAYSAWVAENAANGKLPGFDSESGKAQAKQLVNHAAAIVEKVGGPDTVVPADVNKSLTKADNMVSAMDKLQHMTSATSHVTQERGSSRGISPAAANSLAKDLVVSVYRAPELSEAQAKYLLKNAPNLTPESLQSLDPQTRAKTAVAMSQLATDVRNGAMGEFSKLPAQVQRNAVSATHAADKLLASMEKDPAMRAELNQAFNELNAKGANAASSTSAASPSKVAGLDKSVSHSGGAPNATPESKAEALDTPKSAGRSFDR